MTTIAQEHKYQALRLYHSGQASLSDIKAMFRVTAVAATSEYSATTSQKLFLGTKERMDTLHKMTMTRDIAKLRMLMRFKSKPKLSKNRAEVIADFALGANLGLPHDWTRYGSLVKRTKRVNPSRKGSSKRKIGKTRYIGFTKFNKDFDGLMKSMLLLTKDRTTKGNNIAKQLAGAKAAIEVSTKT